MRNPAEVVETLQPEILHVPINSPKASVLPEALHDTPIPTPLGESWTGPPLSRQEVESRLQQQSLLVYFIGELYDRTYRLGSVTIKTMCVKLNY